MIERKDVMPVNFLKKKILPEAIQACATVWRKLQKRGRTVLGYGVAGPYGYDATPPEQKTSEYFPFTGKES